MNRRIFIRSIIAVPLAPLVAHKPEVTGLDFAQLVELKALMDSAYNAVNVNARLWIGYNPTYLEWSEISDPLRFEVEE